MIFGLFKKKDPVCGMKEQEGKGITKHSNWFCSGKCLADFEAKITAQQKKMNKKGSCCY